MSLPPHSSVLRVLACAALSAAIASAQQVIVGGNIVVGNAVQVRINGAIQGGAIQGASSDEDPGTPVEMFENPNLDRYLRRAQEFLDRSDYSQAIDVLQDVIEGRTVEVVALRPEGAEDEVPDAPAAGAGNEAETEDTPAGSVPISELDARNSVFSQDSRLYRPVRRLCHELLATLPPVGIQIYRTSYEVAAQEMLDEAIASGSTNDLERVANRFFVTLPAGKAMLLLADRQMHRGRYRAAVHVLRDLLDVYPEENRRRLGVDDVWCRFKIALCLRLAGERGAAEEAVSALASAHATESLRILGQLESVETMPDSELFARDVVDIASSPRSIGRSTALSSTTEELVPMWQYRFAEPEPYRDPKPSRTNRGITQGSASRPGAMPFAARYGPATWVGFDRVRHDGYSEPRALFFEHFRLRMTDTASGVLLREGDGEFEPPVAREGYPRVRIAAVDFGLLRPVFDEDRRYAIIGHEGNATSSEKVFSKTTLVAYGKHDWNREWTSEDWFDGDDGLRGVTFLAAPTVFGERLLLPALRNDAFSLECLERTTGRPLWHTPLHAGGSMFFKPPGIPVEVIGGTAYVATNAGCLAAVDAFAGDLRWIRRYERSDTVHKTKRRRRTNDNRAAMFGRAMNVFTQEAIPGFLPTDLIVHEGLLVLAPCDGEVLLAVDAATGERVWMLDGHTRYSPYGNLVEIVGHDEDNLYAISDDDFLVCVQLEGGLVRWQQRMPAWAGSSNKTGRGRGVVLDDVVVVPNMRELLLFDVDNEQPVRRVTLPSFGEGREPLQGSCNVVVDGPWLAVGYAGGVEVYSSPGGLAELAEFAEDPLRKAHYLTRSGDSEAAENVLIDCVQNANKDELRARASAQLLRVVRRRATALAENGDLDGALAAMDRVERLLVDRASRLDYHLARVELCKIAGDLTRHAVEQENLYAIMEGRG